nr:hypothetical protein GCM10010200_046630 [Actinomadura rugatobispora]
MRRSAVTRPKFDERRGRIVGAFSVSAYEAVTKCVHAHLTEWHGGIDTDGDMHVLGIWVPKAADGPTGVGAVF